MYFPVSRYINGFSYGHEGPPKQVYGKYAFFASNWEGAAKVGNAPAPGAKFLDKILSKYDGRPSRVYRKHIFLSI
jgi:hypothetical protein